MIWVFLVILFFNGIFASVSVSSVSAQAGLIQSNNQLVVIGSAISSSISNFLVANYSTSGTLISSFGSNGITTTTIGSQSQATSGALQSTGDIIVAGFTFLSGQTQFAVVRYTTAGVLDATFGTNGIVTQLIGDGCAVNGCVTQSDDSIILAGNCVINGQPQIALMRLLNTGSVDTTFGTNGIVTLAIGQSAICNAVALQSSGEIIVGGFAAINGVTQMIVAGFTNAGVLDTTFGSNGITTISSGTRSGINALAIDANENIVVTGFSDTNMMIARLTSSGVLDITFGFSGITVTTVGNVITQATSITIESSGSIACAGFSDSNLLVAQYTSQGVLDTTFASTGITLNNVLGTAQANDVVMQNGLILAVGTSNNDVVALRFTTSGNLDTTWGNMGIVTEPSSDETSVVTRIWEQESVGTNGGTFTAGAWQTRILNNIISADGSITLSNNSFVLMPGSYSVNITVPAYQVASHQARLQDITNNVTLLLGNSAFSSTSNGSVSYSFIEGEFLINGSSSTVQVQHQCTSTQANDGFGIAAGVGQDEIYTTVKITPIS
jgi:uncharacterized delta-60 repeat protein